MWEFMSHTCDAIIGLYAADAHVGLNHPMNGSLLLSYPQTSTAWWVLSALTCCQHTHSPTHTHTHTTTQTHTTPRAAPRAPPHHPHSDKFSFFGPNETQQHTRAFRVATQDTHTHTH